jgi:mono/diheme cytochrome c family protein
MERGKDGKLAMTKQVASDLSGFGSRSWVRGLLADPDDVKYFGTTPQCGGMKRWKKSSKLKPDELDKVADFVATFAKIADDETADDWLSKEEVSKHPGLELFKKDCGRCHTVDPGGALGEGGEEEVQAGPERVPPEAHQAEGRVVRLAELVVVEKPAVGEELAVEALLDRLAEHGNLRAAEQRGGDAGQRPRGQQVAVGLTLELLTAAELRERVSAPATVNHDGYGGEIVRARHHDPASGKWSHEVVRRTYMDDFGTHAFEGECDAGVRSGHGTMRWEAGGGGPCSAYDGHWQADLPHGRGRMEFADGSTYDGEWRQGRQEGRGRGMWCVPRALRALRRRPLLAQRGDELRAGADD